MARRGLSRTGAGVIAGIVAVAAALVAVRQSGTATGTAAVAAWWPAVALSALLYLASHTLRCVRLALLAIPILGVSGRTAMLLHLYTAPAALVLPLKLGELLRLQQLAAVSGRVTATIVLAVVERAFDAVLLLVVCAILLAVGEGATDKLVTLTVLLAIASLAAVAAFVLAPAGLSWLQDYIVLRHTHRRARLVLASIDRIRTATAIGRDCLARTSPALLVITVAIWAVEIAAMAALLQGGARDVAAAAFETVERVGSEWRWLFDLGGGGSEAARQGALISFAVMIAIWPLVAVVYLRRLTFPPRTMIRRIIDYDR